MLSHEVSAIKTHLEQKVFMLVFRRKTHKAIKTESTDFKYKNQENIGWSTWYF